LGDFQFLFIDLALILPIAIFMGWAGPAPRLCRKRPTADLVSRKVLTPLLGFMLICIAFQAVTYVTVKEQSWYIPPVVHKDEPSIENSQNTALFLFSCFEYILSGVILNAGRPFRQRTTQNCKSSPFSELVSRTDILIGPFAATVFIALLITVYMILTPAKWVTDLMQLTEMSWDYELFLIALGAAYFAVAWAFEHFLALKLARIIGSIQQSVTGRGKKRKEYKVIAEASRI
jgi:cation-transporting ATPase 13A3/4/5